jgi:hypothetical protein
MVDPVRLFRFGGGEFRSTEHVDLLIADPDDRRAFPPAQQLQPETFDVEAQAPIEVGHPNADVIEHLKPQRHGSLRGG